MVPNACFAWLSAALAAAALAAGCAAQKQPPAPVVTAAGVPQPAFKRAQAAFQAGLQSYEDGDYAAAETALRRSLELGLAGAHERAAAYKTLAFIACINKRIAACEGSFRAARAADPAFALTRSEAGHPLWGPVARRVLQ